ncbi:MAG: tyrosine-protein phosphatase [Phycisphaeraceae bacterium]|nr:MAG: tyrosine-protein phosphatase [Phycisphaeraceae bacterium]
MAALLAWFAVEGVVPNLVPKNFGVVAEGRVYRSGELTPEALRSVIESRGIRTIVDFGAFDHDPAGERREQSVADSLGVERRVLYLSGDGTGDPNRYVEALRLMTDASAQPVLVHCAAGAQRTGCAVALYRNVVEGWNDQRALDEATKYRHDPSENPRMPEMYHRWRDEIAGALRDGGTIDVQSP